MNARTIRFLFGTMIASAIAVLLFVLPVPARTVSSAPAVLNFYVSVNTTTDEYNTSGTGTGCSLREAIKTQNDFVNFGGCVLTPISGPETIFLPSGTYTQTLAGASEDLDATGDLDIRKSVTISATGATAPTVLGGAGWTDRIFHVLTGTVTFKGLAIRGGNADAANGGGVRIESGQSLTFNAGTISGNSGFNGGGIYNSIGTVTLTNVTLSGNNATGEGGGIYNSSGTATLTNVTFSGNSAGIGGGGGGILNWGLATLANVTFSGNSAGIGGGGIINLGAATLTNITLSGNNATDGGGIYNANLATLTNVTFSDNSATGNGGGIYNSIGTATLTNATFSGNSAGIGGGIFVNGGTATLKNTIVANSPSGGNCYVGPTSAAITSNNYNLSSDDSCTLYFNQGHDQNNQPAHLGPLANNGGSTLTRLPLPPIVFGFGPIDNGSCPAGTDQRGVSRPQLSACDIGAVEYRSGDVMPWVYLPLIQK